jgi:uncharacterized metal-binding protein YceD (DUF177 family)
MLNKREGSHMHKKNKSLCSSLWHLYEDQRNIRPYTASVSIHCSTTLILTGSRCILPLKIPAEFLVHKIISEEGESEEQEDGEES